MTAPTNPSVVDDERSAIRWFTSLTASAWCFTDSYDSGLLSSGRRERRLSIVFDRTSWNAAGSSIAIGKHASLKGPMFTYRSSKANERCQIFNGNIKYKDKQSLPRSTSSRVRWSSSTGYRILRNLECWTAIRTFNRWRYHSKTKKTDGQWTQGIRR